MIVSINTGSSSLKFGVYEASTLDVRLRGVFDAIGTDHCMLKIAEAGASHRECLPGCSSGQAVTKLIQMLRERFDDRSLAAFSHRVVHGGPRHDQPIIVQAADLQDLTALSVLAPLHQPHNLAGIAAISDMLPDVPQVACFDTQFHRHHPEVAEVYALPRQITMDGVRRYGFHGLSYEFILSRLRRDYPALAAGRVIVAHLGSGASMCAMADGRSIDSTMGFSALDGLPMGTRTGQIDPGVIFHLIRQGQSPDTIERMFYHESGLKGLSGLSNDMRELEGAGTPESEFAIEYFCHWIARQAGGLTIGLGGLDAFVFTAGIGENAPCVRARVGSRLASLGITIDETANTANSEALHIEGASIPVLRLETDEEIVLARHAADLLFQ